MSQPQVVRFYAPDEPYFEFTNSAPYPVRLDGDEWATAEHYYQAAKFQDPCSGPGSAGARPRAPPWTSPGC